MAWFSRLTDIVTCNLTKLLEEAENPQEALQQIIREMEGGVAGAQRSMKTASANEDRLRKELDEHRQQIGYWSSDAREKLKAGNEEQARLSLVRKREADNLVAGLEQQLEAAVQTREHLATTLRALEARLAEAQRRQTGIAEKPVATSSSQNTLDAAAASEIEDELAAMKRELGQ